MKKLTQLTFVLILSFGLSSYQQCLGMKQIFNGFKKTILSLQQQSFSQSFEYYENSDDNPYFDDIQEQLELLELNSNRDKLEILEELKEIDYFQKQLDEIKSDFEMYESYGAYNLSTINRIRKNLLEIIAVSKGETREAALEFLSFVKSLDTTHRTTYSAFEQVEIDRLEKELFLKLNREDFLEKCSELSDEDLDKMTRQLGRRFKKEFSYQRFSEEMDCLDCHHKALSECIDCDNCPHDEEYEESDDNL